MSQLIVKEFGAIKDATIEIKKYNFFIGHTSSGKSTMAKLVSIFNNIDFWSIKEGDFDSFRELLKKYNIDFKFNDSTLIKYSNEKYFWEIKDNIFHSNYEDADLIEAASNTDSLTFYLKFIDKKKNDASLSTFVKNLEKLLDKRKGLNTDSNTILEILKPGLIGLLYEECTPVYIPAERLLITTFSNSIFSLLKAGASIPECIKDFGSLYEKARNKYNKIDIDILNIRVSFDNKGDKVYLNEDNTELDLSQTSSGIQSIIPLWTVFNQYAENKKRQMLVIEEPELNLFPTTQYLLIDWIMSKMKQSNSGSIVITTHSPYILSVIDNLILAQDITVKKRNRNTFLKVKELIPSMGLIKFGEVSSYFFNSNGHVIDIRDIESRTIGAEYIDEASNKLGYIFDELCKIDQDEL